MNLRTRLARLASAVADQAARDPAFAATLEALVGASSTATSGGAAAPRGTSRKGGRRAAATLDPVDLAREGGDRLRQELAPLTRDQLLDIVAEYGMDPGKLVMKWKDPERVIERIVEVATARATKGDSFRTE